MSPVRARSRARARASRRRTDANTRRTRRPAEPRAAAATPISRSAAARALEASDRCHDLALRFARADPCEDLHPFARLEVLVMLEKMRDLRERRLRHVSI